MDQFQLCPKPPLQLHCSHPFLKPNPFMHNKPKKVVVVPYNPKWVVLFQNESLRIQETLGSHLLKVHHIGSTSIEGLIAKPKIDILCIIDKLSNSFALKECDYDFKGELNLPLHYYFRKQAAEIKYNLHVVEKDHGFIKLNLTFRDYIQSHPEAFKEYADLKKELIKDPNSHQKVVSLFSGYNLGKDQFIKKILRKAHFDGDHVSFCMHTDEWKSYHRILKSNFDTPLPEKENHYYFVHYKGADVVSAAHLEIIDEKKAILRSIAADEQFDKRSKDHLLDFIKKWLKNKGSYSLTGL